MTIPADAASDIVAYAAGLASALGGESAGGGLAARSARSVGEDGLGRGHLADRGEAVRGVGEAAARGHVVGPGHQFVPARVDTATAALSVATRYPLDGSVAVSVVRSRDTPWTLAPRVPDRCREPVVAVNGTPVPAPLSATGYLEIERRWRAGDVVAYTMPMPARLTVAHPSVDALRGAVAIERAPSSIAWKAATSRPMWTSTTSSSSSTNRLTSRCTRTSAAARPS